MGFVQFYSDKTAFEVESKGADSYPIHALLLIFSPCWYSWLANNAYAVVDFLPASNVESQERFVQDNVTSIHGFAPGSTVEMEAFFPLASDGLGRVGK